VYWHHAVRSATVMFKRLVRDALAAGSLASSWIAHSSDEALMERLRALPDASLADRLHRRRLFKRALDVPATELPPGAGAWIADDPDLAAAVEDRLAADRGLPHGTLLLDFPRKPEMLAGVVPVLTRRGEVAPARLSIQQVADELHTAARRFRVYVAQPVRLEAAPLLALLEAGADDVRARLAESRSLAGGLT
jgi:hypothetical protein